VTTSADADGVFGPGSPAAAECHGRMTAGDFLPESGHALHEIRCGQYVI